MEETYRTFILDETRYRTLFTRKYEMTKPWVRSRENEIIAFIPGTILEIKIAVGQEVKCGDVLMILEAMKMANEITAPISGKIKRIEVSIGDVVPKGKLMIELE
jgi:biotin carboxyl carrier protein